MSTSSSDSSEPCCSKSLSDDNYLDKKRKADVSLVELSDADDEDDYDDDLRRVIEESLNFVDNTSCTLNETIMIPPDIKTDDIE